MVGVTRTSVFDRLAGPDSVSGLLINAATVARHIARGSDPSQLNDAMFTHSWLFTGPPGSGRSVAAKAFAAALVCSDPSAVWPV